MTASPEGLMLNCDWIPMPSSATTSTADAVLPLRVRYRQEMNGQIVHDSIHRRDGWTETYLLDIDGVTAGFGSIAREGPWKDKPTIFEFYVLPEHRVHGFKLFEALLTASDARFMEIQSSDAMLAVMLHTYARDIWSEKIVFRDAITTTLPANGATVKQLTSDQEIWNAIAQRQGGAEYQLVLDGSTVATGGLLFHYNVPYADIYMETLEPVKNRGFGSYLVQELKRSAYALGSIPCARCDPANLASRATLQKAGLVPFGHILNGSIPQ
jgi:GNAT superfamily N-acetyltransferase